ncbi:MAG: hypothetical protein ACREIT_07755, partial [Tepidisphaeraceae bacterium]
MSDALEDRILSHVKSDRYRPRQPRHLARELELHGDEHYSSFRDALRELMHQGRVVLGAGGNVVVPSGHTARDEITGTYQQKKAGFGFVTPTDPTSHEDLYIPRGDNGGAMTGDVVRARITNRRPGAGGGMLFEGRITEVVERTNKRFVGSLAKQHGQWVVLPDGNTLTQPILTPDAASRHIKQGTKVVVELTTFPEKGQSPQGVITDVLGEAGEKDVDLKSVIIGFNLPGEFLEAVKNQARHAVDTFDPNSERAHRFDLSDEV